MIFKKNSRLYRRFSFVVTFQLVACFAAAYLAVAAVTITPNANKDSFGGIFLSSESKANITWTKPLNAVKYRVDLSVNGRQPLVPVASSLTKTSFLWNVVQVKQTQPNCQLIVTSLDASGTTLSTQNSDLFTIVPHDKFLRFLNTSNRAIQESDTTTKAYYAAIDPTNSKLNLSQWLIANGFNAASNATSGFPYGADASAIYLNDADLGFGRRMFLKTNTAVTPPTVASCVQNYQSLDDVVNDTNLIATVCMEYGPTSAPGDTDLVYFTKFYVYNNGLSGGALGSGLLTDMKRISSADLDHSGLKAVPGLCNTCHGGTVKPLVSPVAPAVSCTTDADCSSTSSIAVCQALVPGAPGTCVVFPNAGDTQAGFIPWDLDNFAYSTGSLSRSAQEAQFRGLNQGALNTLTANINSNQSCIAAGNPLLCCTGPGTGTCTNAPDRQELINGWYGGSPVGVTLPPNNFYGEFVPKGWKMNTGLYLNVIAPNCRACHSMREPFLGNNRITGVQNLGSYSKFLALVLNEVDIEDLVYAEGVMPLARRTYDRFWNNVRNTTTTSTAELLSRYILGFNPSNLSGPGRPIADAGISFTGAPPGPTTLNGAASLYTPSDGFSWKIFSKPTGSAAKITSGANTANPSFVADVDGSYTFRLTVSNTDSLGKRRTSSPSSVTIDTTRLDPAFANKPITFAGDILPALQEHNPNAAFASICVDCHNFVNPIDHSGAFSTQGVPGIQPPPPLVAQLFNGSPDVPSDYLQVTDRVNYASPLESLILTKPFKGFEHDGGVRYLVYETFLQWILEGSRP